MANGDEKKPVEDVAKEVIEQDVKKQAKKGRPGKPGETAGGPGKGVLIGAAVTTVVVIGAAVAIPALTGDEKGEPKSEATVSGPSSPSAPTSPTAPGGNVGLAPVGTVPWFVMCDGTEHRGPGDSVNLIGLSNVDGPKASVDVTHGSETRSAELEPGSSQVFEFGISQYGDYPFEVSINGSPVANDTIAVDANERQCDEARLGEMGDRFTSAAADADTPKGFARALAASFQGGNSAFLFDTLDPFVVELYGQKQCRRHVAGLRNPDRTIEPADAKGLRPFDFEADGVTERFPETYSVKVRVSDEGENTEQELHFNTAEGYLTWFTDCGDPVSS